MGEVYRATDPNLGRQVAIKVLPDAIAQDPERVARFEREARTLATLNHPNIAIVHGFEKGDGVRALVMELVEGPTLADRIAHGPIPLDEALPIAKQIAEALEAAHEQGIIHRDLKPANVKVRADGVVKVLDFGLAKALEPVSAGSTDATTSPTITSPAMMTRIGVILGTAAYMSPEQAKGRAADKRSDVWAFGCVLFEMVTGRRAFEGEDISDTLAAVLRGEPEWTALPANVSPALVALLRGCLDKDRRRRVADLSIARFIIDREGDAVTAVAVSPASQIRRAAPILVAVAAAAIAASVTWMLKPASAPSLARTVPDSLADGGTVFQHGSSRGCPVSGRWPHRVRRGPAFVQSARWISLRPWPFVARKTPRQARARGGRSPFFSPDGQWVGFWQDGQLKKVSITGGAPVALCAARNPWGASWTADNTILFGQGPDGIWRVSGDGGTPEHVVKVEAEQIAHGPQLLPGGDAVLFTLASKVRLGDGADRRPVARDRQASHDPGTRHRRAVCADRSSRVRAWEHPPGGGI